MRGLTIEQAREFVLAEFGDDVDVDTKAADLLDNAQIVMQEVEDFGEFCIAKYVDSRFWDVGALKRAIRALTKHGIIMRDIVTDRYRKTVDSDSLDGGANELELADDEAKDAVQTEPAVMQVQLRLGI